MKTKYGALTAGLAAACSAAIFCGLLLGGMLPLETDIMDIVRTSYATPWDIFLGWIFSPQSESVYEDGWFFHMIARPVQPFFFKLLYIFFRDETLPYLIYRAAMAGLLAGAIYAMAYCFTSEALLSFLCSLFVMTNPGTTASVLEFWDTEPLGQMFQAGALLCFLGILLPALRADGKKSSRAAFAWLLLGLYVLGSVAVKTKDTEKLMLPGILWGFLFISVFFGKTFGVPRLRANARWLMLLGVCALITLPLVWFKKFGVAPIEHHPWDIVKILFWNTKGWEPESMISFFRFRRQLPCSVLASFGFALSWASALLLWPFLRRLRDTGFVNERRWTLLLLLWLVLSLPIFIVRPGLHLPRYLILPLIPCALLFVLMVRAVLPSPAKGPARLAKGLLLFLLLFQIADNARHSVYFRNVLPAIWIKQYKMREEVYKHMTGRDTASPLALHRYMRDLHYPIERMDLLYPVHRPDLFSNPGFLTMLKTHGFLYVGAVEPMEERPGVQLVATVDALGNDPYARVMKKFSSSGREKLYLYLVQAKAAP